MRQVILLETSDIEDVWSRIGWGKYGTSLILKSAEMVDDPDWYEELYDEEDDEYYPNDEPCFEAYEYETITWGYNNRLRRRTWFDMNDRYHIPLRRVAI